MNARPYLLLPLVLASAGAAAAPAGHALRSPDGRIEVRVAAADRLRYSVLLRGQPLVQDATLGIDIDHVVLGVAPRIRKAATSSVDRTLEPPVRLKAATLREHYNELRLDIVGDYAVTFRAYDEGVAYRIETSLRKPQVKVYSEDVVLNFAGDCGVYYPKEDGFRSHNEREFLHLPLKDVAAEALASLPAIVETPAGVKLAIADSDIEEYPGLWLRGTGGSGLTGTFPPYPLQQKPKNDRDIEVTHAADYIAVTRGTRTYPWRILGIAERDADLITSSLVYLLARPSQIGDPSWIRPGKVAWDWWNANNFYGVDFKAGVNTKTYEAFIDFASRYGIEYVILDEGWYPLGNVMQVVPQIDMARLTSYAREKNVGLVLWVVWKSLDDQLDPALEQFSRWGIKGIKVDFMQRDDQPVIDFYHKLARKAADHKLLLDFHGAVRPATFARTWPNVVSTEGVLGLEQSKWSAKSNPEHNVTIPFTRMFVGPMDYTPGAMHNASKESFRPIFQQPMSMGTRAQQLAMYVVYESPLQMLADVPSNYLREPEMMEFLGPVPTVWDETRVLEARLGDYVAIARRRGNEWWVGAMTDWTERDLTLDLSFLPPGSFALDAFQDGPNAARAGSDYQRLKQSATRETTLTVHLAPGGGWAGRIVPSLP